MMPHILQPSGHGAQPGRRRADVRGPDGCSPFLVLPHLVLLFALLGYALRVEAYALLIHDRFPSFAVFSGAGAGAGEAGVLRTAASS